MNEVARAEAAPASRAVIETAEGITVYPARWEGDPWRAAWYEDGKRRQCQAASEAQLTARLAKVAERLAADAPNMLRSGNELIAHYLSPDRRPVEKPELSGARTWPEGSHGGCPDWPVPKVVTEEIPPDYRELPEAERLAIARRLARQVRAGLGGTVSEQLGLPVPSGAADLSGSAVLETLL